MINHMKANRPRARQRRAGSSGGFTLVELLTVVAILSLLAALLMPSLGNALDRARQTRCAANMKGIGTTAFLFAADHEGLLPARWGTNPAWLTPSENPNGYDCQIELQLYAQGREKHGYDAGTYTPYDSRSLKSKNWLCPADFPRTPSDMRDVSYGPNLYGWDAGSLSRVGSAGYAIGYLMIKPDSVAAISKVPLSRTIMFGERGRAQSYVNAQSDPYRLGQLLPDGSYEIFSSIRLGHNGRRGLNWLFFDGHVSYDSDYLLDYASDFASAMWQNFN